MSRHLLSRCWEKTTSTDHVSRSCRGIETLEARDEAWSIHQVSRRRSSHGDNINVLTKEFEAFTVKRFGKQVSLLIIGVNKLKCESTIFDMLPNEVMSNLYVFGSRMLNWILRDVNETIIVTIDNEMFLTKYHNHGGIFASIRVGCNSYRQQCTQLLQWIMRRSFAFYSSKRQDYYPHKKNPLKYSFYH